MYVLLRHLDGDEHRHDVVAAVDDLARLAGRDVAAVERLQDGLLAVDDDRQLAGQDRVGLLDRAGVRTSAAARQEVRQADA